MKAYSQTLHKSTRRGRPPGGLAAIARALGVDRTHLLRVTRGERISARLTAAYQEYLVKHPPATAATTQPVKTDP